MNIQMRHEKPKDHYAVENAAREAFWNLYCPGCNEHYLIHKLRTSADFIPELSYLIEVDGDIVGSIFYSTSKVISDTGETWETITFGPVSILPHLHRQGLGRRLISHTIEQAKKLGHRAIIIGGYPYHYQIYGFEGGKKYNIRMQDGNFYTGLLVLPLYKDALLGVKGKIHFSAALEEPDQCALERFDKRFPKKRKEIRDSQRQFEQASSEIDTR